MRNTKLHSRNGTCIDTCDKLKKRKQTNKTTYNDSNNNNKSSLELFSLLFFKQNRIPNVRLNY